MARTYVKAKRAEKEAETRQRIVEATLALHTAIGPAQTTISMIAERAGVQRHTVYAHFPDEQTLLMACSGLHVERDPLPDPVEWEAVNDPDVRLRKALTALYSWYARNREIVGRVLRDAEFHAATRNAMANRFVPPLVAIQESLAGDLGSEARAALHLAMSFYTWRTLVDESGLTPAAAVDLMVSAVRGAAR
ncbi:MAG TPA: TetR/AcrR family transcriptional regulator [Alphaproteobacteria bacterium]|nr:TetR/AcrR family transcriptional regulator [Alphaproteobacteria bacterium]